MSTGNQDGERPRPLSRRVCADCGWAGPGASVQSERIGVFSAAFHSQSSAIRSEPLAPGRIQTKVCSPRRIVHSGSAKALDQKPLDQAERHLNELKEILVQEGSDFAS